MKISNEKQMEDKSVKKSIQKTQRTKENSPHMNVHDNWPFDYLLFRNIQTD